MGKDSSINDNLLVALKKQFPKNSELVNTLSDILDLGKESVYRRLRGEVTFSAQEISLITKVITIPLENFMVTSSKSRPFNLKITDFLEPTEEDFIMFQGFINIMNEIKDEPESEYCAALKILPDSIFFRFDNVYRFYLFRSAYHHNDPEVTKPFRDISAFPGLKDLNEQSIELYDSIKSSCFILDRNIFKGFVQNIKYFNTIDLISKEEILAIKKDLFAVIDYLEKLAVRGENEKGNTVKIFVSNVSFESNFSYIKSPTYSISLLRAMNLYDIASIDEPTLQGAKKWMSSLIRSSYIISGCGEMQRMRYFTEQRRIIEGL